MGKPVDTVASEKHLGFAVGNVNPKHIISQAVNEFMAKVNMVKSHFKYLPHDVMYKLFKTYCMPLYGCPLWDFSKKSIDKFYITWRKAIRFIFDIPRTTHCVLLHEICNDMSVQDQLYSRFINFFKSLINSSNVITNICANLALHGSNSIVSNNITIISKCMSVSRLCLALSHKLKQTIISDEASVINELLYMRYSLLYTPNCTSFFNHDELNCMIETLCTM